ncbi:2-oxo acid dehydrogenase subunit E2 [Candidatus Micrarchaeota archaeon]|nr:2-oxo acid dehydrogenase subunit E2 [Candidatus Micrarchaeota archaeon]
MATDFRFPDVGEGITEGVVVRVLVKEGDRVEEHQPLMEIETDKAVVQMPSPAAGTILKVYFKAGDRVKVGSTLLTIGEKGEKVTTTPAPPVVEQQPPAPGAQRKTGVVGELPESLSEMLGTTRTTLPAQQMRAAPTTGARVLAAPSVRQLAQQLGVDLTAFAGTGPGGVVTAEDVKKAAAGNEQKTPLPVPAVLTAARQATATQVQEAAKPKVQKKYDFYGYIEHFPLTPLRETIAKRMVQSKLTAPHVTHMDEADVTNLWRVREQEKIKASGKGIKLTFLPFVIKACQHALEEHPFVNAMWSEGEIILKKYYNIGFAVDTEEGLIVPVVKNANMKSILDIAREAEDLADRTRKRTVDLGDLKGGTFTITNVGSLGGLFATPIINFPEVAILATGKIYDKAVPLDGEIVARKVMPLSLAFDHRVFDGAEAARFTTDLIGLLENPKELLKELEKAKTYKP